MPRLIRRPYRLMRLYQGAGLKGEELGESLGASAGLLGGPAVERRRGTLLAQAVTEGKLGVKQLSAADSSLAGKYMSSVKVGTPSGLSKIGGFFENLGTDIWEAGKGLPSGIWETGKAVAQDVFEPPWMDDDKSFSRTREKVINPTVAQYKYMYGGKGAPEGESFWDRLYKHPLQPILDVATVASLGTTGAARAGLAPALTRTTGRRPIVLGEGAEIPRAYSGRPLRNVGQRVTDPLEAIKPFGDWRAKRGTKRMQREATAREMAGEASAVRRAVTPLVQTTKDMSHEEGIALDYALRGWNTPEQIQGTREMFGASLRGELPEGSNISDFERIFDTPEDARKFVEYKANLPESVEALILNPTPRMLEAAKARQESVSSGFERLGVTPEEATERAARPANLLAEFMRGREGGEPGPPEPPEAPPPGGPPPLFPAGGPVPDAPLAYLGFDGDIGQFIYKLNEDAGGPLDFDDYGGTPDAIYESFRTNPPADMDEAMQRFQEFVEDPDLFMEIQFQGAPTLGDAIAKTDIPEPNEVTPEQASHIARALQAMRGDFEPYRDRVVNAEPGDPIFRDLNLVITSILMNRYPTKRIPNEFVGEFDFDDAVNAIGGELPDYMAGDLGPESIPQTWVDVVDQTLDMGEFFEKSDPNVMFSLGEEGEIETETMPEIPDTPQSLFEAWGMGDEADIPEIPDTPGAFFASMGDTTRAAESGDNYQVDYPARYEEPPFEEPPDGGAGPPEVTGGFGDEGPAIEPTWVPEQLARGFKEQRMGWLGKMASDRPEQTFARGKRDRRTTPSGVTAANMFETSGDAFLRRDAGDEALMAGATRVDPKAFIEHVARRERDIIAQGFDQTLVHSVAAKDPESGEPARFSNNAEVEQALGKDWVLVHDTFPIRWFVGESEFLRDTINKLQEMQDMGIAQTDANVMNQLEGLAEGHASEFVRKSFGAKKIDGVAVPRNFFDYQKRIVQVSDPFDHPAARAYARYIHRWRTLTLAYMPRWALNTAVGSFMLNVIKGVDPRYYRKAAQIKSGKVTGENWFAEAEGAGVNLGNITGLDYLEMGMHGVGGGVERQTGVKVTGFGERIVEKVQQIEDYFRRASFVQSLDRAAKQRFHDMGTVLTNFEKRRGVHGDDEHLTQLLNDPQLVKAAIDDLNRFSYNFAALGPYERRYVRMAIPFWGWYKFISKFAYRLPAEYPGRANILANLGMLGNMSQEEYGMFPEWMRGFIGLDQSDKGELTYLSTLGLNPLGQFFNPLGEQGIVQGAVNVGMASPPIQAGLGALGVDTLRGGVVPISPEEGVGSDFFGSWIDLEEGKETSPQIEGAARRGLMGLLRAAPQFRMAEERLAGGRPVYPESIPFFDEHPMPIREGTRRDTSILAALGQSFGVFPKHFDLRAYQRLLPERVKYARARNKTQMKKLRKSLGD